MNYVFATHFARLLKPFIMANDTIVNAAATVNAAPEFVSSVVKAELKSISTWSVKRSVQTESVDESTGEVSTSSKDVVIPMIRVYLNRNFVTMDKSGRLSISNYFDVTRAGFIRQMCQANIDIQCLVDRCKRTNERNREEGSDATEISYFEAILKAIVGAKFEISRQAVAKDTEYTDFAGNAQKASRDQFFTSIVNVELTAATTAVFEKARLDELAALIAG